MTYFYKSSFCSLVIGCSLFSNSTFAASHFLPTFEKTGFDSFAEVENPASDLSTDYKRCLLDGYKLTSCPENAALAYQCPWGINLYKQCISYAKLCNDKGYVITCAAGYEPNLNQTCPYDSLYVKCQCARCLGYDYTLEEANAQGYVPDGEPCLSCGVNKYKRKINPCKGFEHDNTNCNVGVCGRLSGDTCVSGMMIKYKECRACPVPPEPQCAEGLVNMKTYWCEEALKCWWPKI